MEGSADVRVVADAIVSIDHENCSVSCRSVKDNYSCVRYGCVIFISYEIVFIQREHGSQSAIVVCD